MEEAAGDDQARRLFTYQILPTFRLPRAFLIVQVLEDPPCRGIPVQPSNRLWLPSRFLRNTCLPWFSYTCPSLPKMQSGNYVRTTRTYMRSSTDAHKPCLLSILVRGLHYETLEIDTHEELCETLDFVDEIKKRKRETNPILTADNLPMFMASFKQCISDEFTGSLPLPLAKKPKR
jgi:hypothetical protein